MICRAALGALPDSSGWRACLRRERNIRSELDVVQSRLQSRSHAVLRSSGEVRKVLGGFPGRRSLDRPECPS